MPVQVNLNRVVIDQIGEVTLQKLQSLGVEAVNLTKKTITKYKAIDTGILRESITFEVYPNELRVRVGTVTEYAPYIHQGTGIYAEGGGGRQTPWKYKTPDGKWHTTSGMKPRPFLKDAIFNNKQALINAMKEEVV